MESDFSLINNIVPIKLLRISGRRLSLLFSSFPFFFNYFANYQEKREWCRTTWM